MPIPMLALLRSVVRSVGTAVRNDPEVGRLVARHPRLFGLLGERLGGDEELAIHLAVGLALASLLILSFFSVLEDVVTSDPLVVADGRIAEAVLPLRTPALTRLMLAVTVLGDWEFVGIALLALCVALSLARRRRDAQALLTSVAVAEVFIILGKQMVRRPRPFLQPLVSEASFSFPSGHTLIAVSFYGLLAFLLYRSSRTRLRRALALLGGLGVVLAIGFSRIYLGAHWPSDVLASLAAGGAWLTLVITAIEIEAHTGADTPGGRTTGRDGAGGG